jgi:hypothetical protein
VIGVNGKVKGLPTLEQAIRDELFAPGAKRENYSIHTIQKTR